MFIIINVTNGFFFIVRYHNFNKIKDETLERRKFHFGHCHEFLLFTKKLHNPQGLTYSNCQIND